MEGLNPLLKHPDWFRLDINFPFFAAIFLTVGLAWYGVNVSDHITSNLRVTKGLIYYMPTIVGYAINGVRISLYFSFYEVNF
jgi:hypothetical protein